MAAEARALSAESVTPEPIFVFGTDLAGKHETDSGRLAVSVYSAEKGTASGQTGHAFAIPYRNTEGALLSPEIIGNYVEPFLQHAAAHPDSKFSIARFGCEEDGHDDASMARLFAKSPKNCRLPEIWARILNPKRPARLLLYDPGAHMNRPAWQQELKRYIDLNVPLWNVPGVEIISVGSSRSIVANDIACKNVGLVHRVVGQNEGWYGSNALVAAEAKAVWVSTHLLSIFDFDMTGQPQQIRILGGAQRGGLVIDQLNAASVEDD